VADEKREYSNDRWEDEGGGQGPDTDVESHEVEISDAEPTEDLYDRAVRVIAEVDQLSRDLAHVGQPNAGDAFKRAYREITTVCGRGELRVTDKTITDV
jgi:hypothetical protein